MTAIPMPLTSDERSQALNIARAMASAGVPIFVAPPCAGESCSEDCQEKTRGKGNPSGFHLPARWHATVADPSVVGRWRPGWALCAVGGHVCDFLDIDPRNGGVASHEALVKAGRWPKVYGRQMTPSGGVHDLIAPLRTGKTQSLVPGIDLQGGRADGTGRGFVFLAPTERASKVDGRRRTYRWRTIPDLKALVSSAGSDNSGAHLASFVPVRVAAPHASAHPPGWRPANIFCDHTVESADQAIEKITTEVTEAASESWDGFRDVLMRASFTLGGFVGGGHLSEGGAASKLTEAIEEAGHSPDENDLLWIEQGLTDGSARPIWVRAPDREVASERPLSGGRATNLPDEFWRSRKTLEAIRRAAHARARSADAVLGEFLARLSSILPGTLRIDTGIAMPAACNYYSILLGTAGTGKSTAAAVAESLFPPMYDSDSIAHPLGSGQGIAAAYGSVVDGEFRQNSCKAFFFADEGAALLASTHNRESTTLATLREAWTGRTFGQRNATAALNRRVSDYSLGLWVGMQPTHAAELFSETHVDDGTLARFVWFSAIDPAIPARVKDTDDLSVPWDLGVAWNAREITVPQWIKDELRANDIAVNAGTLVRGPGQEHRGVLQVKTAVLLAILDGRHDINTEDWALAAMVLDTSDAVAQSVRDAAGERAKAAEEKQTARRLRALSAEMKHTESHEEAKVEKMVLRAIDLVKDHPGISKTRLAKNLSNRELPMAHAAIERALVREGGIREEPSDNKRGVTLWPK